MVHSSALGTLLHLGLVSEFKVYNLLTNINPSLAVQFNFVSII